MFETKFRFGLGNIFRDEKGQNIIEFALLTPVLLMIFLGVFDFGWLLHKQIQLDHATRAAARRAAVGQDNSALKSVIVNICGFEVTDEMITIQVRDEDGNPVADSEDRSPDNYIYVGVDIPDVQLITPIKAIVNTLGTINLHSESVFLIE